MRTHLSYLAVIALILGLQIRLDWRQCYYESPGHIQVESALLDSSLTYVKITSGFAHKYPDTLVFRFGKEVRTAELWHRDLLPPWYAIPCIFVSLFVTLGIAGYLVERCWKRYWGSDLSEQASEGA